MNKHRLYKKRKKRYFKEPFKKLEPGDKVIEKLEKLLSKTKKGGGLKIV